MDESVLRTALASLNDCGSSLHTFLDRATLLVVLGVALEMIFVIWEYLEDLHDFKRGIVHPPEKPNRLLFVLGFLGAALVAVGVGGELYAESKIATLETCIRKGNDALFLLLSKETGDATKNVEIVRKEAGEIQKRLDAASGKMSDLEADILAIGPPRWRLLENDEAAFTKSLKRFPGQRVTVMMCGNGDGESLALQQSLMNLLPEAGWDTPKFEKWGECPGANGIDIYFVSPIPEIAIWTGVLSRVTAAQTCGRFNTLHDAIGELCDVLYKLRIEVVAWREKPDTTGFGVRKARNFFDNDLPNGPAALAYSDPGRIFILIGRAIPVPPHRKSRTKPNR